MLDSWLGGLGGKMGDFIREPTGVLEPVVGWVLEQLNKLLKQIIDALLDYLVDSGVLRKKGDTLEVTPEYEGTDIGEVATQATEIAQTLQKEPPTSSDMWATLFFALFIVPGAIVSFLENFFSESTIMQILGGLESYSFDLLSICTDGISHGYGDDPEHRDNAQGNLTWMYYGVREYLNPFEVRYVVIPPDYDGNAEQGDLAVLMDFSKLSFVICVIGEKGGDRGKYNEVSLSAAWDLGYTSAEANGRNGPAGNFGLLYLPGTKKIAKGVADVAALLKTFRRFGYWLRDYALLS